MQRPPRDVMPECHGPDDGMYLGGAGSLFVLAPVRALLGLRGQYFALAALIVVIQLLEVVVRGRSERPMRVE